VLLALLYSIFRLLLDALVDRRRPDSSLRPSSWDRDSKFSAAFDEVFKSEGVDVIHLPFRRPVANAFAERWVGSVRRECLDRLLIFGRRHLEKVLAEFIDHYNLARPHQVWGKPPGPNSNSWLRGWSEVNVQTASPSHRWWIFGGGRAGFPAMLLGLTYQLVRFLTDLVLVRIRSDAQLRAEVLALRHQLRVMERKMGRPAWQPADRLLLAAISQLLVRPGWSGLLPKPETLLGWHRDLVRRKWAAFRHRPPRLRPRRDPERRALILKLAEENPRWGYKRIQGEALKLGFKISHMGVAKILRSQGIPPAPRRSQTTWREFVRQHAAQMLACDFFTVETVWLQRLYVLFFIEIAGRKVHLAGITANPTGEWVAQQARNLAWKLQDGLVSAKFLLRDRDSKFAAGFDQVLRSERLEIVKLPFRSPRANSICERFVGTCRRELLDHLLVFGARHLEGLIKEFLVHYHQARPHQGLEQRCPEPVATVIPLPGAGKIVRDDRLGGLLHEYSWAV
jgi:transposase InsO family protein